jgi:hypothetical protein
VGTTGSRVRTPGDLVTTEGRRIGRRGFVKNPLKAGVITWPPAVRFYDDEHNLDHDITMGDRVPPECRKMYQLNGFYKDAVAAVKEGLRVRSITARGLFLSNHVD